MIYSMKYDPHWVIVGSMILISVTILTERYLIVRYRVSLRIRSVRSRSYDLWMHDTQTF